MIEEGFFNDQLSHGMGYCGAGSIAFPKRFDILFPFLSNTSPGQGRVRARSNYYTVMIGRKTSLVTTPII